MEKCKWFTNAHCAFECPNAAIDEWENKYDLDASRELAIEHIKCRDCIFYDKYCTCIDCYFYDTPDCPKYELKRK